MITERIIRQASASYILHSYKSKSRFWPLSVCLSVRLPSGTLLELFFSFLEQFISIMLHYRYTLPFVVVSRLRYTSSAIYVRSLVQYGRVTLTLLASVRHVCHAAVTQCSANNIFLAVSVNIVSRLLYTLPLSGLSSVRRVCHADVTKYSAIYNFLGLSAVVVSR